MPHIIAGKLTNFFEPYEIVTYQKGQIFLHAGDEPQNIWQITSGKVKQYHLSDRGDEAVLNVYKTPSFFPMAFAINKTPNEYFYEADSQVEIRKAPVTAVVAFLKENPDVLYDLLSRVYVGTDALLSRLVGFMSGNARHRVIFELIIEATRFGTKQSGHYNIDLNESDIAARAGLSRETVSREMHKLKLQGLILIDKKQITVVSMLTLKELLDKE